MQESIDNKIKQVNILLDKYFKKGTIEAGEQLSILNDLLYISGILKDDPESYNEKLSIWVNFFKNCVLAGIFSNRPTKHLVDTHKSNLEEAGYKYCDESEFNKHMAVIRLIDETFNLTDYENVPKNNRSDLLSSIQWISSHSDDLEIITYIKSVLEKTNMVQ